MKGVCVCARFNFFSPQADIWSLQFIKNWHLLRTKLSRWAHMYVNERKRLMIKALRNMKVWLCIGKIWLEGKMWRHLPGRENLFWSQGWGKEQKAGDSKRWDEKGGERCGEERTRILRLVHARSLLTSFPGWAPIAPRPSSERLRRIHLEMCAGGTTVVFLVTVACWHIMMIRDKYFETLCAVLAGTLSPCPPPHPAW